jgi:hypothetical protein
VLWSRLLCGHVASNHLCDLLCQLEINLADPLTHTVVHDRVVAVVKLERKRIHGMHLFGLGERVVEKLSLVLVLSELLALRAGLDASDLCREINIGAFLCRRRRYCLKAVRPVVGLALGDGVAHGAVTVEVHHGTHGLVDGEFLPVDTKTRELSVGVGKVAALEERVVTESDTGNNMASAESDLLGLSEELIGVLVQLKLTDIPDRHQFLGPDFGGIEDVEVEVMLL